MKKSLGVNVTGVVTDQTIFTVPTGYDAHVTLFFVSNVGGSTQTATAKWHDGSVIPFIGDKSFGAGDYLQFGGGYGAHLVMKEGDYFSVSTNGGDFSFIISYDLLRTPNQS